MCETFIPCFSYPCLNNGTCENSNDYLNYTCTCPENFTGENCELPIPCDFTDFEFFGNLNVGDPCLNLGVCTNSINFLTYDCNCTSDYTGANCETFIPCSVDPCENSGTCYNFANYSSYSCGCNPDYTGYRVVLNVRFRRGGVSNLGVKAHFRSFWVISGYFWCSSIFEKVEIISKPPSTTVKLSFHAPQRLAKTTRLARIS